MNFPPPSMLFCSRFSHSLAGYKLGLLTLAMIAGSGSAVAGPYEDVWQELFVARPSAVPPRGSIVIMAPRNRCATNLVYLQRPPVRFSSQKKPPHEVLPVEDASARATVITQAARCDPSSSDRSWLDCFYAAAQSVRGTLGLKPVPQLSSSAGMIASTRSPDPSRAINIKPAPTSSVLTSYSFDGHGFFTVHLANGQVWRQLPDDTDYANWREPASRYAVKASRGMLGSFNLNVTGSSKLFKVERIS